MPGEKITGGMQVAVSLTIVLAADQEMGISAFKLPFALFAFPNLF